MEQQRKAVGSHHKKPTAPVGEIDCAHCGSNAVVRRQREGKDQLPTGKFYYSCARCGVIRIPYLDGQEWILKNARMYGPDGKPAPKKLEPAAPPPPKPAPARAPSPAPADSPEPAPPPPPPPEPLTPKPATVKVETPTEPTKKKGDWW